MIRLDELAHETESIIRPAKVERIQTYRAALEQLIEMAQYKPVASDVRRQCGLCVHFNQAQERQAPSGHECYCGELSRWVQPIGSCELFATGRKRPGGILERFRGLFCKGG